MDVSNVDKNVDSLDNNNTCKLVGDKEKDGVNRECADDNVQLNKVEKIEKDD